MSAAVPSYPPPQAIRPEPVPDLPDEPSLALEADIAQAKDAGYGSIALGESKDRVEYPIVRKPNALLLAELGRVSAGDMDAFGVIADIFDSALGDKYVAFKKHVVRLDLDEQSLIELMQEVVQKTMGRPTD